MTPLKGGRRNETQNPLDKFGKVHRVSLRDPLAGEEPKAP